MITKKEFAEYIVEKEKRYGTDQVGLSSSYAVAADFLGLLSKEDSEYAKTRGGTHIYYKGHTLSVRELLDLLPNTVYTP